MLALAVEPLLRPVPLQELYFSPFALYIVSMDSTMHDTTCAVCQGQYRTDNRGENGRIDIPGGGWVHYGCLLSWLIDDAIARHFPGIVRQERIVVKARMGVVPPSGTSLRTLSDVGHDLRWTGSVRANQVETSAFRRWAQNVSAVDTKQAEASALAAALEGAIDAAEAFVATAKRIP